MEWHYQSSPGKKKFNVQTSAGKVMASVFWDSEGILSVEFLEGGAKINSERYEFKTTNSKFRPNRKTIQVFFLHENARPHEGGNCNSSSLQFRLSTLQLPPFCSLKDSPRGRRFADDDELKQSVHEEFRPLSQELCAKRLMQSGKSLSIMRFCGKIISTL